MNLENSDLFDKKPNTWSVLSRSARVKAGLACSKKNSASATCKPFNEKCFSFHLKGSFCSQDI